MPTYVEKNCSFGLLCVSFMNVYLFACVPLKCSKSSRHAQLKYFSCRPGSPSYCACVIAKNKYFGCYRLIISIFKFVGKKSQNICEYFLI